MDSYGIYCSQFIADSVLRRAWLTQNKLNGSFVVLLSHTILFGSFGLCLICPLIAYFGFKFCRFGRFTCVYVYVPCFLSAIVVILKRVWNERHVIEWLRTWVGYGQLFSLQKAKFWVPIFIHFPTKTFISSRFQLPLLLVQFSTHFNYTTFAPKYSVLK